MKRSTLKTKAGRTNKFSRNSKAYKEGGGESRYAKKHKYCIKNGVWGFEVPEPKPWKGAV
jgi:hypothetical protein